MRWKRRTVDSKGVRLAVRDSGSEGVPVVLVHGLGFGQRTWDHVVPRLSAGGLRVVSYDQRGHGASGTSDDYSPSAFCEDLAAVLGELGLEKPILVGHSLGATIALEHAAAHGGCAVVVCVDGGVPVALPSADWEAMRAEMRRPIPRLAVWAMKVARLGTKLSFEELRRVVEVYEVNFTNLEGAYDRITCPILMVVGSCADPVPKAKRSVGPLARASAAYGRRTPRFGWSDSHAGTTSR